MELFLPNSFFDNFEGTTGTLRCPFKPFPVVKKIAYATCSTNLSSQKTKQNIRNFFLPLVRNYWVKKGPLVPSKELSKATTGNKRNRLALCCVNDKNAMSKGNVHKHLSCFVFLAKLVSRKFIVFTWFSKRSENESKIEEAIEVMDKESLFGSLPSLWRTLLCHPMIWSRYKNSSCIVPT